MTTPRSTWLILPNGDLRPQDDITRARMAKRQGERVRMPEPPRRRSGKQNAMYWAMLTKAVESGHQALRNCPTPEALHNALKIALGYFDVVRNDFTGEVFPAPQSASFDAMGQAEFNVYLERATDLLCLQLGCGQEELMEGAAA